jgi:hypothetical protein
MRTFLARMAGVGAIDIDEAVRRLRPIISRDNDHGVPRMVKLVLTLPRSFTLERSVVLQTLLPPVLAPPCAVVREKPRLPASTPMCPDGVAVPARVIRLIAPPPAGDP